MKHGIVNNIGKAMVAAMSISLSAAVAWGDDSVKAAKLNNEGVALVQRGDIKAAIGKFKDAIDADVHHVEAAHNLGKLLIAAKQYALAEKILQYVTRENPDDMGSFVQLAQTAALLGKDDAVDSAAERIANGDKTLLPSLALLLSGQGSQSAAERTAQKAVEVDPGNAEAWYDKGIVAQRSKKLAEAEAAYRKSVGIESTNAKAWVNLGNVIDAQGRSDDAIAAYEKAYAANAESPLALYNLGRMLVLKSRDPKRGLELLQAATRHGDDPGAKAARELLLHLVAQTKKGGAK